MPDSLQLNERAHDTGSTAGVWNPEFTLYCNFDDLRADIQKLTPPNSELLAMAKKIKPDFSWYPTEDQST